MGIKRGAESRLGHFSPRWRVRQLQPCGPESSCSCCPSSTPRSLEGSQGLFLEEFPEEFPEDSITQGLVSEAWEEEHWDLEANRPSQGQDSLEHLGQVLEGSQEVALGQGLGPFLRVPSQGLQYLVEQLVLLQLIKLPKLVLGLEVLGDSVSVGSVGLVALAA